MAKVDETALGESGARKEQRKLRMAISTFMAAPHQLLIFVNGQKHVLDDVQPETTLLRFLRGLGFTGPKLGCGEGGCGACTVMVSFMDRRGSGQVVHRSVNSCLTPLCSMDSCHVTTTEGIGSQRGGLHPVQKRIAEFHGSQCGFCTPGVVMSLYTLLRTTPLPTTEDIEEAFDGNLCRCTGYRPLLDAARTFAADGPEEFNCGRAGGCCRDGPRPGEATACTCSRVAAAAAAPGESQTEPIFPPELVSHEPGPLRIQGRNVCWTRPGDLATMLAIKAEYPDAKFVLGNTEIGIETKFKAQKYPQLINTMLVPELHTLGVEEGGVRIGSGVSLSTVIDFCKQVAAERPTHETRGLIAMAEMLRWFASRQIRNVATLGGNIATASPISDMNPMLMALRAQLEVASAARGSVVKGMDDFFLGYRRVNLARDEVIVSVFLPWTREYEFVSPFKQDDISIVCSTMRVLLAPAGPASWRVEEAALIFGGMAPTTKAADGAQAALVGAEWAEGSLAAVYDALAADMPLPADVPGGQAQYRRTLCSSFLFKFYVRTTQQLAAFLASSGASHQAPAIAADAASAGDSYMWRPKPVTRGSQDFERTDAGLQQARPTPHAAADEPRGSLGEQGMHKSAYLQASGEAEYGDDVQPPPGTLNAAYVQSTRGHARIVSVDTAPALALDGVECVLLASDIRGTNNVGPVFQDEHILAEDEVTWVGQPIGIVVAASRSLAWAAARRVAVVYEDLPAVYSIHEAIEADSYHAMQHNICDGDVDAERAASDVVVEGEMAVGAQEHFYLETNNCVAVPSEDDTMTVTTSTQNPTETQHLIAAVLGVPAHNIVARVRRLGGGFGGKETRAAFVATTAAVAAHHLQKPVRISLDRDVDMGTTGTRHAFVGRYRAGASRDGQLRFLDIDLYNNAGHSLDLSGAVMDRALFHIDNAYKFPALHVRGHCCKTNTASNTAFRGFGGPQGMIINEAVMDHLARELGMPVRELRAKNLYQEGDRKHFGETLERCNLQAAYAQVMQSADVQRREEDVAAFNAANRYTKRGLAVIPTAFGIAFTAPFMNQGGALVHVYTDGTVMVSHGGTEMGQGLHTKVIQIAARCFGIDDSKVRILETATDKVPNSSPTAASMSTDLYGMATLDACEQIRARLPEGDSWEERVSKAYFSRVNLSAQGFYTLPDERCGYDFDMEGVTDNAQRGHPFNYFTYGVACSEVELDALTGDMRVLRADVLMDLGASINPELDIGQIEGAFAQGLGWCTMEELVWGDREHPWVRPGHLFTKGPGAYKIPSFNDVPIDFRVSLMRDVLNPFAVHSSKAVGEPPLFMASSAFFAAKEAVYAFRDSPAFFRLNSPCSSERLRLACEDEHTQRVENGVGAALAS